MIYRDKEMQDRADSGRLRWYRIYSKYTKIGGLLYDEVRHAIILTYRHGHHGRRPDFRVLTPLGVWQVHSRTVELAKDFRSADRTLGLRLGKLEGLWHHHYTMLVAPLSDAGCIRENQWTRLNYAAPLDYKTHFKKMREEAPPYLWQPLYDAIVRRRYRERAEASRFDWERAYPGARPEILRWFELCSEDHDCMDNFRVARVGRRKELRRYKHAQRAGCCGSRDVTLNTTQGAFYVGFNYGH